MAKQKRNKKGQFIKASRSRSPQRRKSTAVAKRKAPRRNAYIMNAPRKAPRRKPRRNPPLIGAGGRIMGFSITEIAYTGLGFIAPPAIEGMISGFLPVQITGNKIGKYGVKAVIVFGSSWIGSKFMGKSAGRYIAIGGITNIVAALLVDFVPQVFSGFSGYMNPGPTLARSVRAQPKLGRYLSDLPVSYASGGSTVERLDPRARF